MITEMRMKVTCSILWHCPNHSFYAHLSGSSLTALEVLLHGHPALSAEIALLRIPLSGPPHPPLLPNCSLSAVWLPEPQSTLFLSVLFFSFNICLYFPASQLQSHSNSEWTSYHFRDLKSSCGLLLPTISLKLLAWYSCCSEFGTLKSVKSNISWVLTVGKQYVMN